MASDGGDSDLEWAPIAKPAGAAALAVPALPLPAPLPPGPDHAIVLAGPKVLQEGTLLPFGVKLPAPKTRNAVEKHYACSRMREHLGKVKKDAAILKVQKTAQTAIDILHKRGLVRSDLRLAVRLTRSDARTKRIKDLVITCTRKRGKAVRHAMPLGVWLDLAFNPVAANRTLGRASKMSDTFVRNIRKKTAHTIDKLKERTSDEVVDFINSGTDMVGASTMQFDGTEQKVHLKFAASYTAAGNKAWHVLVSLQMFLIGGGTAATSPLCYNLMRKPVACLTKTAESYYDGLFASPQAAESVKIAKACTTKLKLFGSHYDMDSGSNNLRLMYRLVSNIALEKALLLSVMLCGNHGQNLCENASADVMDHAYIDRLTIIANLFRMGAYLLRIIVGITLAFEQSPLPIRRAKPAGPSRFVQELGDFIVRNYRVYAYHRSNRPTRRKKRQKKGKKKGSKTPNGDDDVDDKAEEQPEDAFYDHTKGEFTPSKERRGTRMQEVWDAFIKVFNCFKK